VNRTSPSPPPTSGGEGVPRHNSAKMHPTPASSPAADEYASSPPKKSGPSPFARTQPRGLRRLEFGQAALVSSVVLRVRPLARSSLQHVAQRSVERAAFAMVRIASLFTRAVFSFWSSSGPVPSGDVCGWNPARVCELPPHIDRCPTQPAHTHKRVERPNDKSSTTRPTARVSCNQSAMAGFAAAHG